MRERIDAAADMVNEYQTCPGDVMKILIALYKNEHGKAPDKKVLLLDWFFDNYQYDHANNSWYSLNTVTYH